MNTLVIIIAISAVAIYFGFKILAVAFEIINVLLSGAGGAISKVPSSLLKILGRRKHFYKIDIHHLLTVGADKSLRLNEILSLNNYQPISYPNYDPIPIKFESQLYKLEKRNCSRSFEVDVDDLLKILTSSTPSVRLKIQSILDEKKQFPLKTPPDIKVIQPPESIKPYKKLDIPEPTLKLPLWSGFFSRLNSYVYKEFQHEINLVENAKKARVELYKLEEVQAEQIILAHQSALSKYEKAVLDQEHKHNQAIQKWREIQSEWVKELNAENEKLTNILQAIDGDKDVEEHTRLILDNIVLPNWVPNEYEIKFDQETKILIVEHEFIDVGAINWFKLVALKSGRTRKPLNQKELKLASEKLYPTLTIKIICELAQQLKHKVDAIAINGWSHYTVKETGNTKRAYCSSLLGTMDDLLELNLSGLDPISAFSNLKGTAARTLQLTPIAPKIQIDTNDPRFVDEKDILGVMNAEENLASMDWQDFEHLCRQLFEKVFASSGAIVKVTQASRDLGVDAIIFDPDTIRGGKIVIQAKRYVNTVDVSAVRDLWGTVNHEGAMKGILVTTSQYGPESYSFIQDKPLTLIDGQMLLGLLEEHGYKFRINLEEARRLLKDSQN